MHIEKQSFSLETSGRFSIENVTPHVQAVVDELDAKDGIVWVSTPHTSAALATNEFEEKLVFDMNHHFIEMVPPDRGYYHDMDHIAEGEQPNAHAHILAALLDQPVLLLLRNGTLELGTWEEVMFFELCGPRDREVDVVVLQ